MIVTPDRPKARSPPTCSRCQCVLNRVVARPAPGSSRRRLSTASVNSAAPLSTSTRPVLAVRTRTLPPAPVSITKPSLTGTTAGLSGRKADGRGGGGVSPRTPPIALFSIALRFMAGPPERSDTGDHAGAIPEALHLDARLVQQREVQIGNRRMFGQLDLP